MIDENENAKETIAEIETETETDDLKEKQKEIKNLEGEIKQKDEEYGALYDKYLRVNAEYDNFRKRTAKEKEGIYSDATADVLKNILPVLDNIERAVQFFDVSQPEKVFEGFKIIYSQFLGALEKIGVEEIKSEGEQFNPEVHNAVMHEENDEHPDNTIMEVMQKGYVKGDKIIRPAMVKVVN
ncbi:MAG: nucleotide exchange factor GrpE [Oscillospiraceae bacterium]|nr:nucleotide exchange factor GrpE [Oscillospiraceae bacterium]